MRILINQGFLRTGFHGFLSALNDEIIEEEKRRKEPGGIRLSSS